MNEAEMAVMSGGVVDTVWSPVLIVLAYLIASLAAYTALDLAGRVVNSVGVARKVWLFGGAAAMGLGIWSMHFVGMMSLGLFVSAFANTEFQAVQFLPAMVFPQLLLCGLLVPRDQMADVLDAASSVLPLTYAYEGLQRVTTGPGFDSTAWRDLAIVLAVTVLALALGATTLRRRTG